jgi:hypothetical protein
LAELRLEPGRVYRTENLRRIDKNPTRLVGRLVKAGKLQQLRRGVYYAPQDSAFGEVPPSESELLRSYFRGKPYLRTGPSVWNSLGLGSTAVEAVPLVYNTTRTGQVRLGGRRFELRRVRFPRKATVEYFVIDFLGNSVRAGVDLERVRRFLAAALRAGRFDSGRLLAMAIRYGSRATQKVVQDAIQSSSLVTE